MDRRELGEPALARDRVQHAAGRRGACEGGGGGGRWASREAAPRRRRRGDGQRDRRVPGGVARGEGARGDRGRGAERVQGRVRRRHRRVRLRRWRVGGGARGGGIQGGRRRERELLHGAGLHGRRGAVDGAALRGRRVHQHAQRRRADPGRVGGRRRHGRELVRLHQDPRRGARGVGARPGASAFRHRRVRRRHGQGVRAAWRDARVRRGGAPEQGPPQGVREARVQGGVRVEELVGGPLLRQLRLRLPHGRQAWHGHDVVGRRREPRRGDPDGVQGREAAAAGARRHRRRGRQDAAVRRRGGEEHQPGGDDDTGGARQGDGLGVRVAPDAGASARERAQQPTHRQEPPPPPDRAGVGLLPRDDHGGAGPQWQDVRGRHHHVPAQGGRPSRRPGPRHPGDAGDGAGRGGDGVPLGVRAGHEGADAQVRPHGAPLLPGKGSRLRHRARRAAGCVPPRRGGSGSGGHAQGSAPRAAGPGGGGRGGDRDPPQRRAAVRVPGRHGGRAGGVPGRRGRGARAPVQGRGVEPVLHGAPDGQLPDGGHGRGRRRGRARRELGRREPVRVRRQRPAERRGCQPHGHHPVRRLLPRHRHRRVAQARPGFLRSYLCYHARSPCVLRNNSHDSHNKKLK